jgi:hypothetical protein
VDPEDDRTDARGAGQTDGGPGDRPPLVGLLLGLAILAAPFLALLYGLDAGLAVMALALAAVGVLALLAARTAEPDLRQRLLVVAAVNAALALACLVLLLVRQ